MDPIYGPEVPRRIVQIAGYRVEPTSSWSEESGFSCMALADDGSLWRGYWLDGWRWAELSQLPAKKKILNEEAARIMAVLESSVTSLPITVRAENCFRNNRLYTVADVVRMGEDGLLRQRNFGKKSVKQIQEILERKGLRLGMNLTPYGLETKTPVGRYDPMVPLDEKEASDAQE